MEGSKKYITVFSIAMMNILAILGMRWFMFAAKYGAASVLIYGQLWLSCFLFQLL